jgi:peroxiredoxin
LADYREHYAEIRAAGADVVVVSVDSPARAEALRRALELPFAILSDPERQLARDWDIFNARERGGIARPALFIIDQDRRVRYSRIDAVATRVPASEVVRLLRANAMNGQVERKVYIPTPADLVRSFRNLMRRSGR